VRKVTGFECTLFFSFSLLPPPPLKAEEEEEEENISYNFRSDFMMNFFWFKKNVFRVFQPSKQREKATQREQREHKKREKMFFRGSLFLHSTLHLSLHTKFFSSFVFTTKIKSTRDGLELYLYK
tara:strand:+ start:133 stop:504 length:372 start_codon:yes stop_codon:yes gene_type:complete